MPASPQLSRNGVPPRSLQWRRPARDLPLTHTPRAPGMEGSSRPPPRRSPTPGPHNGRAPRLAPTFARLPPPSGAPVRLLPSGASLPAAPGPAASNQEVPRCDTGGRRYGNPPAPAPPLPAPSLRADPPPPPSWTHNEARRCPTPPRSLIPPPPSWARNEASAAPGGPVAGRRGEPALAEAGGPLAAGGMGARCNSRLCPQGQALHPPTPSSGICPAGCPGARG